ncbi:putative L-ascorbate peroxidase [Rosa chinensis]|uniref:Putative L-ascorbate peroxidase n=1 Tax=Rosa chinensis TaxID=74649 RepID=A0A2P6PKZ4_ROSCH|nr:putative L-ascorbate peroxidase [Rosa chinensis]
MLSSALPKMGDLLMEMRMIGDLCCLVSIDEEAFFRDYAESHKKLSELGFTTSSSKIVAKGSTILAQGAVGVAICAAVVILGYFYEVRKRLLSILMNK